MGYFKFIICFVLLSIIGHAVGDRILTVDLKMVDSPLITMLKQNIHPRQIEMMVRSESSNGIIPVPLTRFMDTDFYGEVLFGHPGQKMRMSFDTSWSDSWVPTITCSALSPACATRKKYDPSRSPFSVPTSYPFKVPFGSQNLEGRVYYDLIHINQVNVSNQAFAAVSQIPSLFVFSKFDGILGMNLMPNDLIPPVIFNLMKQKKIDRKVFSFYFNRNPISTKGGTLVFGGVEPRHFKGNFTYVDLIKEKQYQDWIFRVEQINITSPEKRSTIVCEKGCNAVASTGSNPISGPPMEIDDLNKAIKAREFLLGRYLVDCTTVQNLPKVGFTIGDRIFTLSGNDYVQKIKIMHWFTVCLSSFSRNDDPNDTNWYIGGAFMSKYYTTFDMDLFRIGFADAQL